MAIAQSKHRLTPEEFLAWDATQTLRHEYVDGEVFAMAGAGDAHVTAAGNVYLALRQHLAGTPCRTFITDMKLHVNAAKVYFYPDVMVTCSASDAASATIKYEPVLLVEVLSPSTAAFDRGNKFATYRTIATLREYLLVDPDKHSADLYRLGSDGLWVLHPFDENSTVHLASVQLDIPPALLWAELPPVEQN
jgi:Uma2 family endonuclease